MKACYVILLYLAFGCALTQAMEQGTITVNIGETQDKPSTFEVDLATPSIIELQIAPGTLLTFSATQRTADVVLSSTNCGSSSAYKNVTINTPGSFRIAELLFIDVEATTTCKIKIFGKEQVDQRSISTITLTSVKDKQLRPLFHHLNQAGESWHLHSSSITTSSSNHHLLKALSHYVEAAKIAKAMGQFEFAFYSQFQHSIVLHYLGQYNEQAGVLSEMKNSPQLPTRWLIPVLLDLARHSLFELGNTAEAKQYLYSASALCDEESNPLYFAEVLELQAAVEAKKQRYSSAILLLEKSYEIQVIHGAMFSGLNNAISIGYFYLLVGDFVSASNQYRSALALATEVQDSYSLTNVYIKLATVHRNLGQFDEANNYISKALESSINFPHSYLPVWANLEKARLLVDTGQNSYAINFFEKARQNLEAINALYEAYKIDLTIAELLLQENRLVEATTKIGRYFSTLNTQLSDIDKAQTQVVSARILTSQGKYGEALLLQQQAQQEISESDDTYNKTLLLFDLAVSNAHLGNIQKSKQLFHSALNNFNDIPSISLMLSRVLRYLNAIEKHSATDALEAANFAVNKMLKIHTLIQRSDLRSGFLSQYQSLVSKVISLDPSLTPKESLLLAESVRAEQLERYFRNKSQAVSSHSNISQELKDLSSQIGQLFTAMQSAKNSATRKNILNKINAFSELRYQKELQLLATETENIDAFDAHHLAELQNRLDQQAAILFIDISEQQSHSWLIDNKSVKYHPLPGRNELKALTHPIMEGILNHELNQAWMQNLTKVSNLFLGESEFPESMNSLHIITDNELQQFPFAILKNPLNNTFWYESVALSQHYSLNFLHNQLLNTSNQLAFDNALVIANPKFITKTPSNRANEGFRVSDLPYSGREASIIASIPQLNTDVITTVAATKENVTTMNLSTYDIIHFATHAIANNELLNLGGIVLSNADNGDNLLLTPEIRLLNINAHLVVLSGCETSFGYSLEGEGNLGVSRAFFQSGAKNVIGSLWEVQDDATAILVGKFYEYLLKNKLSMPVALAKAQHFVRTFKRQDNRTPWKSPFYWAGFVLHGAGT